MRVIQLDTRPRRSHVPDRVWTPGNTHAVMREHFDASNAAPPKRPLWELTAAYNAYQCKKIGWGYESLRVQDPIERHASWIKIMYALGEWDSFDGPVMIMDSDAWIRDAENTKKLVSENLTGNIAFLAAGEPPCDETITRGAEPINGGILCFLPRPEVREFLQHAWDTPGEHASEWPWEQVALNQTYKSNVAGCQSWTKILPPDVWNTPAGSHIVHCWWKDIAHDLLVEDFLTTVCDDHLDRQDCAKELAVARYDDHSDRQDCTKELVVARYDENVDWIHEYLAYVDRVTIYDKSETPVASTHPKIRVVRLPNVGREAHAYAHHFAQNELCDVIVCTQGRFQDHVPPDNFKRMVRDDDNVTYGRKHDALDVAWNSTPMAHFGWTEYSNHAGASRMCPVGMTMGEYYTTYISDKPPASFPWVEGAIFKTNASKVRRFPVAVYEKIRGTLETSSNPEAAHVMERFWGSMVM